MQSGTCILIINKIGIIFVSQYSCILVFNSFNLGEEGISFALKTKLALSFWGSYFQRVNYGGWKCYEIKTYENLVILEI